MNHDAAFVEANLKKMDDARKTLDEQNERASGLC